MIGHKLRCPEIGTTFEVYRIRRERHELVGELMVRCNLPGAKTVNGCLVTGDFNFSSVRARQDRAKLLKERSHTNGDVDWYGLLEEFTQGVFEREREGDPAINIWDIPIPEKVDDFSVDGIALPRKHPAILFGDGGSAKSYIALYIAGKLGLQGVKVALFDWELSGDEHRERFGRLFGAQRPELTYVRCEAPLVQEIERLARIVRDQNIAYAFFDSISFACDGRPEEAEVAARYIRSTRSLGIGSLHIAHVNKSEEHDKKPFGSSWWHNGARSTWFVKAEPSGSTMELGFFHRKSNLGPLRQPFSLQMSFTSDQTIIDRSSITETDMVDSMSTRQKMIALLEREHSLTILELAERINSKVDTVRKAANRGQTFDVSKGSTGDLDRVILRFKSKQA